MLRSASHVVALVRVCELAVFIACAVFAEGT